MADSDAELLTKLQADYRKWENPDAIAPIMDLTRLQDQLNRYNNEYDKRSKNFYQISKDLDPNYASPWGSGFESVGDDQYSMSFDPRRMEDHKKWAADNLNSFHPDERQIKEYGLDPTLMSYGTDYLKARAKEFAERFHSMVSKANESNLKYITNSKQALTAYEKEILKNYRSIWNAKLKTLGQAGSNAYDILPGLTTALGGGTLFLPPPKEGHLDPNRVLASIANMKNAPDWKALEEEIVNDPVSAWHNLFNSSALVDKEDVDWRASLQRYTESKKQFSNTEPTLPNNVWSKWSQENPSLDMAIDKLTGAANSIAHLLGVTTDLSSTNLLDFLLERVRALFSELFGFELPSAENLRFYALAVGIFVVLFFFVIPAINNTKQLFQ